MSVFVLVPVLAFAQTEEAVSVEDTLSAGIPLHMHSDSSVIVFPGLEYGEESFTEYFDSRFDALAAVSRRPEFSFVPETGMPYTLLYSYGGYGFQGFPGTCSGAMAMIPSAGSHHWVTGRNEFDIFNLYSSTSVYGGFGLLLTSNIELNAGGVLGASFLRDGLPVYHGGVQMSLVARPTDNTSVMVWGQYLKINPMSPAPSFMPGGFQRISVGASAKFKVGNTTFGIGASVSNY